MRSHGEESFASDDLRLSYLYSEVDGPVLIALHAHWLGAVLSASREGFVAQSTPITPGKTSVKPCTIDQTLPIRC